jgi:hypothetical protein
MTRRQAIKYGLLGWLASGFLAGTIESCVNRYPCCGVGSSGCTYESYASYLLPGRVLSCELFRKRFDKESLFR